MTTTRKWTVVPREDSVPNEHHCYAIQNDLMDQDGRRIAIFSDAFPGEAGEDMRRDMAIARSAPALLEALKTALEFVSSQEVYNQVMHVLRRAEAPVPMILKPEDVAPEIQEL